MALVPEIVGKNVVVVGRQRKRTYLLSSTFLIQKFGPTVPQRDAGAISSVSLYSSFARSCKSSFTPTFQFTGSSAANINKTLSGMGPLPSVWLGMLLLLFVSSDSNDSNTLLKERGEDDQFWRLKRSAIVPATLCEDSKKTKQKDKDNHTDDDDDDDPYANLPEEDEPTDCSMCNTFRQGPCRPQWRKLEHCLKDSENKEGGAAEHCMRYFTPHQTCLMEYMNLYLLIGHEMKQEIVQDAELAFSKPEERRSIAMPDIDWSVLFSFLAEPEQLQKQQKLETISSSSSSSSKKKKKGATKDDAQTEIMPLWKRFPENTEPLLLNLEVALPDIDETTNFILKVAYVLDQDGKVLGFSYNDHYGDLFQESKQQQQQEEGKAGETTKGNDGGSKEEVKESSTKKYDPFVKVNFVLLPGITKTIQLKAYYSENPVTADPSKELLDGVLCETSPVGLPKSPQQQKAKKQMKKQKQV